MDLTLPGHNYLGPGTKIINNLNKGIVPTDNADKLALQHDIDYLLANDGYEIISADINYLKNVVDSEGLGAGMMLMVKDILGFTDVFLSNDNIDDNTRRIIETKRDRIIEKYTGN